MVQFAKDESIQDTPRSREEWIELLYQRLLLIREHFDEVIFQRALKELKLVQIYHQQALRQFELGAELLSLWARFT